MASAMPVAAAQYQPAGTAVYAPVDQPADQATGEYQPPAAAWNQARAQATGQYAFPPTAGSYPPSNHVAAALSPNQLAAAMSQHYGGGRGDGR